MAVIRADEVLSFIENHAGATCQDVARSFGALPQIVKPHLWRLANDGHISVKQVPEIHHNAGWGQATIRVNHYYLNSK